MGNGKESTKVSLEVFDWEWDEGDRDANFKHEVATYSREDPMPTLETMSRYLAIPVGAIIRYLLVKWAASGSTAPPGARSSRSSADGSHSSAGRGCRDQPGTACSVPEAVQGNFLA